MWIARLGTKRALPDQPSTRNTQLLPPARPLQATDPIEQGLDEELDFHTMTRVSSNTDPQRHWSEHIVSVLCQMATTDGLYTAIVMTTAQGLEWRLLRSLLLCVNLFCCYDSSGLALSIPKGSVAGKLLKHCI